MSTDSTAANLGLDRPKARKRNQSLTEIFLSLGVTGLKVFGGYVLFLSILTAIHFPYHADQEAPSKIKEESGAFYADIYAASAPSTTPEGPVSETDSKYVQIAREMIQEEGILPKVTDFAKQYGLSDKRVLDVGAGTGYLQDVVPNYVGLDISPSARRYFHKPFVQASATDLPFRDNEFDAAWSVWVLEHVPKPEQALHELRRVVKDGGLLYLKPAWNCAWWLGQGYQVRPYSDFDTQGKIRKASLNLLASPYYWLASQTPIRLTRKLYVQWSGKSTRLHYRLLEANYQQYWVADSDAVNGLDYYEMMLWFTSRGDECLNCSEEPIWDAKELVLRIHKHAKPTL